MENKISYYFEGIKDPRVTGRCAHLLSDILIISVCTYITGGTGYQDMYLFGRKRAEELKGSLLELPTGAPSADTYEMVFACLETGALKINYTGIRMLPSRGGSMQGKNMECA